MKYPLVKLPIFILCMLSAKGYSELPKDGWIFNEIHSTEMKISNSLAQLNLQAIAVGITKEQLDKLLIKCSCKYSQSESSYKVANQDKLEGSDDLKGMIITVADSKVIELTYEFNDGQIIGQQNLKSK